MRTWGTRIVSGSVARRLGGEKEGKWARNLPLPTFFLALFLLKICSYSFIRTQAFFTKMCRLVDQEHPGVCLPSTVYCLLSTVYCLLSTVYCLLSTDYCLLKRTSTSSICLTILSGVQEEEEVVEAAAAAPPVSVSVSISVSISHSYISYLLYSHYKFEK
jgi:hypothetical protein